MKPSDLPRKPISPETFVARFVALIFLFAIVLSAFVLPWVFTGVR